MKNIRVPLLGKIIIAIILGIIFGNLFDESEVRAFLTFNGIFSQFLGFMIPLIIVGLVTPAIDVVVDRIFKEKNDTVK